MDIHGTGKGTRTKIIGEVIVIICAFSFQIVKKIKEDVVEIEDCQSHAPYNKARAQLLITRLDGHVDEILKTTVPKGKCIYNGKLMLCLF